MTKRIKRLERLLNIRMRESEQALVGFASATQTRNSLAEGTKNKVDALQNLKSSHPQPSSADLRCLDAVEQTVQVAIAASRSATASATESMLCAAQIFKESNARTEALQRMNMRVLEAESQAAAAKEQEALADMAVAVAARQQVTV